MRTPISNSDFKCASNEALLKLLNSIPADLFKKTMIEHINVDGISFYQRCFIEDVAKMSSDIMIREFK